MALKLLVTGGCGFLGSHIVELFRLSGWVVDSFDNLTKYELEKTGFHVEKARRHNLEFIENLGARNFPVDVSDSKSLRDAPDNYDFIIHTAAQPAMTLSIESPDLDFETNVVGTLNMLKLAHRLKVPIVNCASVHVYGNELNDELDISGKRFTRSVESIPESQPLCVGTLTPLHASKTAADIYTKVFCDSYGVRAGSFRLSGIYGERQFGGEDHGWVANFVIRHITGRPINIFGSGFQTRDIVYAGDVADACLKFYHSSASGVFNIGGGPRAKVSLLDVLAKIQAITGSSSIVNFLSDRHGDLRYFVCDIEKAFKNFNWHPKVLPDEGIHKLLDWVKENRDIFEE